MSYDRRERQDYQGTRAREYVVSGDDLVAKVKELVREGNIRRLIIKDESARTLIEVPLTLGVVGAVLLPVWVAIGRLPLSPPATRSRWSGSRTKWQ